MKNKKMLVGMIALVMALMILPGALAQTPISTCAELQDMNLDLAGDYYLTQDIDCSATSSWNGGEGFVPVGVDYISPFTGKLDGQGYNVIGLYINRPSMNFVGLFGDTSHSAEIENIGLIDVIINGHQYAGGLVGFNNAIISNSYSTGSASSVGSGSSVGGLVGVNTGTISNSYATGSVSSNYEAGGLVGANSGTISNSYATASASSYEAGGLVGRNNNEGTISNSYSTGSVSGSGQYIGGLIGYNQGQGISNSYWDNQTSGQAASAGGTGKTTSEMKQQSTFSGWDFDDIWNINEGITYPFLRWQVPAVQDADSDSVADNIDNCVNDYNPDQSDIDATEGGDVCDDCPACAGDGCCVEEYSDAQNVDESGATIVIESDSVLDIPASALTEDTSISITKGTGSNFKICMPESGECGTTVSTYTIGPTGQTFNNDYTLKLSYGDREECSWGACEIWYSDDNGITWSNPWGPPAIEDGFLVISANHFTEFAIVVVNKTYVQNVTVTLTAYDSKSGVSETGYCIDSLNECAPDTIYTGPVLIDGIGVHYLRYQAYDNAGNIAGIRISRINIIESCDAEPPIIEILTEGVMGNNNWFVSVVNWTIRAIDNLSGVKSLDYSVDKQ